MVLYCWCVWLAVWLLRIRRGRGGRRGEEDRQVLLLIGGEEVGVEEGVVVEGEESEVEEAEEVAGEEVDQGQEAHTASVFKES